MRRLILMLLVLAIPSAAVAQGPPAPPSIVTRGQATLKRVPDQAWVQIAAETRATTPAEAQRLAAEAMTSVQAALKKAGVAADAMKTTGLFAAAGHRVVQRPVARARLHRAEPDRSARGRARPARRRDRRRRIVRRDVDGRSAVRSQGPRGGRAGSAATGRAGRDGARQGDRRRRAARRSVRSSASTSRAASPRRVPYMTTMRAEAARRHAPDADQPGRDRDSGRA